LSFLSYSAALNYKISNNSAIYGRYSNGKKAPGFQIYTDVSTKFGEQNLDPKIQTIEQFEVGFKTRKDNLSLTITPFYSQLLNIPNSVTFTNDQTGLLYNPPALFNNTQTLGVEVDANLELTKNFSIKGAITFQSAKATLYKSWFHVDHAPTNTDILIDNSGNKAANTPDMMANITPEYATDKFYANFTWSYMGARQANFANAFEMPAFSQINFAAGYNLTPKVKISANINNLLNSYGMMGWVAPGSFPFNLNLEGLQASDVAKNSKAFYETFSVPARALYLSLSYKF
jgi:iron complex outermembrane recepter protein